MLYEPTETSVYRSYIHEQDQMMNGPFSWRYLMDVYVANNGHEGVTKEKLRKELKDFIKMVVDDCYETFDLVADNMVEQIKKEV